jgi:nitric oxide reductase NorQ protein
MPLSDSSGSSAPSALSDGDIVETVFWRNEGEKKDRFPFRATHVNGRRAGKVLLCADQDVVPGRPCRARVLRVTRPGSPGRGFYEVKHLGQLEFALDPNIYVDRHLARSLQVLLEAGYSILLDGPQGSGKTVLSREIAAALGMKYVYFNCASVYEATDFIATLQVRAHESGTAETVFMPTDIRRALLEAAETPARRYLVFLDEFNRCRPMARNGLMPALDSTRKIFDPTTNAMLSIPENVQFCAAINNGDQFVGTTAVDPAQMDRFATLKVAYPPADEEAAILARRFPTMDPDLIDAVVTAANAVRRDDTLGVDLSMRATEEACTLLSHPAFAEELDTGEALHQALKVSFAGRFAGRPEEVRSDAGAVWRAVSASLLSMGHHPATDG